MNPSGFRCRDVLASKGILFWGLRPKLVRQECGTDLGHQPSPEARATVESYDVKEGITMREIKKNLHRTIALLAMAIVSTVLVQRAVAQDQPDQDDPPSRVARLGHIEGSVSFQPAGESEWVEAVRNRPMTTGDKVWADRNSRAELQLGSAVIDLNSNTGISFINLDDRTVQVQLSSGSVSVRVRHLDRDDVFEIDTPNQAFSIFQPGR